MELSRPSFRGRQGELEQLVGGRAAVSVIGARPGLGGTRLLEEIEIRLAPWRSLYLATAGAEPLGALRRAFSRCIFSGVESMARRAHPARRAMLRLLSGEGIDLALAAELIVIWVTTGRPAESGLPIAGGRGASGTDDERTGAILVDDVMQIDDPSLEAIAAALRLHSGVRAFLRFAEDASLPAVFEGLSRGPDVVLEPLSGVAAEQLVTSVVSERLSSEAARRWALAGGGVPLGLVEAVVDAALSGELSWDADLAAARARGKAPPMLVPSDWIGRRLRLVPSAARRVLRALAILGIEASAPLLHELLADGATVGPAGDALSQLTRAGWIQASPDGSYTLASQTHRAVILAQIPHTELLHWHAAASLAVERMGGKLASAEAARHAAIAGHTARAVDLALAAARASHAVGFAGSAEALLSFAGRDQSELASQPPVRLDTWIEQLRASGGRDGAAVRMEAIALLSEGHIHEALARLREDVHVAVEGSAATRSRAWLAYGVGLAVADRTTEALFAGLEALARARESGEPRGEQACARFLARLSRGAGHLEAALTWDKLGAATG